MIKKQAFLSLVRSEIDSKSMDSLKKLVLEFARLIPCSDFAEALFLLGKKDAFLTGVSDVDLTVNVKQLCERVGNGDYHLGWEFKEDCYGSYYDDDETLEDKDGLGAEIQGLLETAIVYVKQKRYSEAFSAFDNLFSLSVTMDEYDDVDLCSMFLFELISLDISDVLLYYSYAAVMTLRGGERVRKLYNIEEIAEYKIKMLEIIGVGSEDIPEREEFEEQWIEFLSTQDLNTREHMLLDAVLFRGGIKALLEFTLEHGAVYQTSYVQLVEMYIAEKEYSQAVVVILDGLLKLSGINNVRERLADLLMNIGVITGDKDLIEKAAWEGYTSSGSLRHFIAICKLENEGLKTLAVNYMRNFKGKSEDCNYIRFLYGDYLSVYNECVCDKNFLSWSMSEKGKMIPMFIALLSKKASLSPCSKKLIEINFPYSDNIGEEFLDLLVKCRKPISEREWKIYFNWCLEEAEGRIESIVGGKHRSSYYKASALIVSLAEVIFSLGNEADARRFIINYKEKYPRHTAFHACLRLDINLAKIGKLF